MLAQLLSVIYALVMVAVLIALVLQVLEDGLLAPSSIFLVAVAMSFIIAALLHPLEFSCLLHGLLYYITIPSMYMLLIIYSLFNLNDVTWGTRETPQAALERQQQQQAEAAQGKGGKKNGKLGFLAGIVPGFGNSQGTDDSEGSFEFSCAGLFKLMCCVHEKPKDDTAALILKIHEETQKTSRRVEHIEKSLITHDMRRASISTSSVGSTIGRGSKDLETSQSPFITNLQPQIEVDEDEDERSHEEKPEEIERNDLQNPFWIEDKDLRKGPVDFLSKAETNFWTEFIKKYLLPLSEDREKKKKIEAELLDLRNFVVGAFFMFNAVFVTAMFLLQLNKDKIYFNWPLGGTHNFTYRIAEDDILLETDYLQLEPLGLLFVGFYAVVIVVQFTAMLCHRWGTFSHIMCHTAIGFCNISTDALTETQVIEKQGVKAIRNLQNLKTANEDSPNGTVKGKGNAKRRQTIVNMVKQTQSRPKISTMDRAFVRNFEKTIQQRQITTSDKRRKSTLAPSWDPVIDHLITRRNTVLHKRNSIVERRNSQMMDGFGGHRGSQMGNTRRPTADTLV
jgi:chitin synthase